MVERLLEEQNGSHGGHSDSSATLYEGVNFGAQQEADNKQKPADTKTQSTDTAATEKQTASLSTSDAAAGGKAAAGSGSDSSQQSATSMIGNVAGGIGYLALIDTGLHLVGLEPYHIQDKIQRYFLEKFLKDYSTINSESWNSIGDIVREEDFLAGNGGKFKPTNVAKDFEKEIKSEQKIAKKDAKHETAEEREAHQVQIAELKKTSEQALVILKDLREGTANPEDRLMVAKIAYDAAIVKADQAALKESKNHGLEKRLINRLAYNKDENYNVDAVDRRIKSVEPMFEVLGASFITRMKAASFLEDNSNSKVGREENWQHEADTLRHDAIEVYKSQKVFGPLTHDWLAGKYKEELKAPEKQ